MLTLRAIWMAFVTAIACQLNEHSLMIALLVKHQWQGTSGTLLDGTHYVELVKMQSCARKTTEHVNG